MDFSMVGPAIALGLSCIGCCIGCWIAGAASHAAMSRTEEGHGKFIGMAAAPSSQVIYGFLLMLQMSKAIQAGSLSPVSAIAIECFLDWLLSPRPYSRAKFVRQGFKLLLNNLVFMESALLLSGLSNRSPSSPSFSPC